MKKLIAIGLLAGAVVLTACATPEEEPTVEESAATTEEGPPSVPKWTFDEGMIFPADRSLLRPEDGVAMEDGRLIIADQQHGLRVVEGDGSHRPFGRFSEAGYEHSPPEIVGGPNGVTLEPSGTHLLVADVYRGGLYRVEIATEATERIYQHPYGVNMARRDSRGGLWFTQSTQNRPERGEVELFESVGIPEPDGALFYLPPGTEGEEAAPVQLADGFLFANGFVLDEANAVLYLSETTGSRVLRFRLDVDAGQVSDPTTAFEVNHPDNLEMDRYGRLWIASPIKSEILVFDPTTGALESAFRLSTPESEAQIEAIEARLAEGVNWLDLLLPELFSPAPGLITGMILSPDGEGAVYATGLGDAIIRFDS